MRIAKGLTLIEVLIAAVILFAVLSLSAMSIQALRQSSSQAQKAIDIVKPSRMIMLTIQQQIRANPQANLSGNGQVQGVKFDWEAKVVQTGSAPEQLDLDTGTVTVPPERFQLYQVNLRLTLGDREQQFQFKELAWLPLTF